MNAGQHSSADAGFIANGTWPCGHLTLSGVALALRYGFDMSLGAFPLVVLGAVLIWIFEIRTKLPMEALTAVVFASDVAIAFTRCGPSRRPWP